MRNKPNQFAGICYLCDKQVKRREGFLAPVTLLMRKRLGIKVFGKKYVLQHTKCDGGTNDNVVS